MTMTDDDNGNQYPHEKLPGTDMQEWLKIKRVEAKLAATLDDALANVPLIEGEIIIRINGKNRSGQQVRAGQLVDIPMDEAMTILETKLRGAKSGSV